MQKIVNIIFGLFIMASISITLTGCNGGSYSEKQVNRKIMMKYHGYKDVNIDSKYDSTKKIGQNEIETYKYTITGVAAHDICQGMNFLGKCSGKVIKAGTKLKDSGKVEMNQLDKSL